MATHIVTQLHLLDPLPGRLASCIVTDYSVSNPDGSSAVIRPPQRITRSLLSIAIRYSSACLYRILCIGLLSPDGRTIQYRESNAIPILTVQPTDSIQSCGDPLMNPTAIHLRLVQAGTWTLMVGIKWSNIRTHVMAGHMIIPRR